MSQPQDEPPEAWPPAARAVRAVVRPLSHFLHVQAASGIVLLVAALAALLWVNLLGGASYDHFWHLQVHLGVGSTTFTRSLHFWVNDGLMTIFFFVVGLEIRREIHEGELSEPRRAALPLAAALGGMAAPALIYLALNVGQPARQGWGVPMATDIAFAVGVLAPLCGPGRPALRVLLLALAIVDDIGAILVIAIFYAQGFSIVGLGVAASGVAAVIALQRAGARSPWTYVPLGVVVWAGLLASGIHPTLSGVILGLLTPARAWYGGPGFVNAAAESVSDVRAQLAVGPANSRALFKLLERFRLARREALAPAVRLEAVLHPWVAFAIMPIFALANAGVSLRGVGFESPGAVRMSAGIVVGLVVGKPVGILLASWAAVRFRLAVLPRGVTWAGVGLVGVVAGIGFTMAIFVAGLAFPHAPTLALAKLAVLTGSGLSILVSLLLGRAFFRPPAPTEDAAQTEDDAEGATEY